LAVPDSQAKKVERERSTETGCLNSHNLQCWGGEVKAAICLSVGPEKGFLNALFHHPGVAVKTKAT
jgi:hypothetical protein